MYYTYTNKEHQLVTEEPLTPYLCQPLAKEAEIDKEHNV
jgi:hypothetical protein